LFPIVFKWQDHDASFALRILPGGAFLHCSKVEFHEAPPQPDNKIFAEDILDECQSVLEIMEVKISTMDLLTLVRIGELRSKAALTPVLVELVEEFEHCRRRGLEDRLDHFELQRQNHLVLLTLSTASSQKLCPDHQKGL
jgi:hypothetical protein